MTSNEDNARDIVNQCISERGIEIYRTSEVASLTDFIIACLAEVELITPEPVEITGAIAPVINPKVQSVLEQMSKNIEQLQSAVFDAANSGNLTPPENYYGD